MPSNQAARSPRRTRRVRQIVQALFMALFLSLLFGVPAWLPGDLFLRLDPLTSAAAMIAGRLWIPALALAGLSVVLVLLAGRAWCGWVCPLGTLLDWLPARRGKNPTIRGNWRQIKQVLLLTTLWLALLGNLAFLSFDPITLFWRTGSAVVRPALGLLVTAGEGWLYPVQAVRPALEWLDRSLRGPLPLDQSFYLLSLALVALLLAVLLTNALGRRTWCSLLCPLGALLGWIARLSWLRRTVEQPTCIACRRCSERCSVGAIDSEQGFVSNPAECTLCLSCADVCPTRAITFRSAPWQVAPKLAHDPSRREFLFSLGLAASGLLLARVLPAPLVGLSAPSAGPSAPILPPGASSESLSRLCLRCGQCFRLCPTGGLVPQSGEGGLALLWAPALVPRKGPCDYACIACGQGCPTGAIPALTLEEKRLTVIGTARIDRLRCLPWAQGVPCVVCQEVCPLPRKAVTMEQATVQVGGSLVTLFRPSVIEDLCIGCGICEMLCPLPGEAAIRVYPTAKTS